MKKLVVSALAVAALAGSAFGQTQPTVAFRWQAIANGAPGFANSAANGFTTGTVLTGNTAAAGSGGTFRQTFALQVNVQSNAGVLNAGLLSWNGQITQDSPGLLAPTSGGTGRKGATAAVGGNGTLGAGGITGIDAGQSPTAPGFLVWPEADPAPSSTGKPANFAVNTWATIYQVTFQTNDLSARTINLAFALSVVAGVQQKSVGMEWVILPDSQTNLPPDPPAFPGADPVPITWGPSPYVASELPNAVTPVGFSFSFIPAPSSAALLGLGGLVASRRRRA